MIKKITIGLLVPSLISFFLLSTTTFAEEISDNDPSVDGKLSLIKCIQKGGLDFWAFWDSVIYSDNLAEGVIEPWNDVLGRNQCHSSDVLMLGKKQDALREAIRDAFMTCKTQKIPSLKEKFLRITAEIYYVRHIVDGGIVMSMPFELLSTRIGAEAAITSRGKIYKEMYEKYAKKDFIPVDKFDNFFLDIESKYKDRIPSYIDCKKGTWEAVSDKWREFVESGAGTGPALKGASKRLSKAADNVSKEAASMKTMEFLKSDLTLGGYLKSFVQMNINDLPPEQGLQEIGAEISKNMPLFGNPTQSELSSALSSSKKAYDAEKLKSEIDTDFYALYGNISDETFEIVLNTLDGRNTKTEQNDGLIEIIEGTYPALNKLKEGTKTMNDRQCPTSK
ncbi:MAG: hypothetical protein AAB540_02130 [Patescibacteria group bacterium]|mgnify:FL=1